MERKEFMTRSGAALRALDESLGDLHDDLDVDLAGDVLTLSFTDGGRFIINAHSAAGQVWMAAGTEAWHFDWTPDEDDTDGAGAGRWIAAKNGDELMGAVGRAVGEKLGIALTLTRQ